MKEGGEDLSAGEKQLVCVTRLILNKNQIVLIDEATSSIDNVTEEAILQAINDNFHGCTIIIVTHRLKTIIRSDLLSFNRMCRILFLKGRHCFRTKMDTSIHCGRI